MKEERLKKLEGIIQELVSRFIFEEIEDSEQIFWVITITRVKVSTDLSYLDVFVSSFYEKELLAKTLAKHAHWVQKKISQSMDLRKIPRIRFRYDEEGKNSSEIISQINNLSKNTWKLWSE